MTDEAGVRAGDRPLRSLRVHNYYHFGGGEDKTLAAEMALLREHGHHVELFSVKNDPDALEGDLLAGLGAVWNLGAQRRLATAIEAERPDLVHIHNTMPLLSPAVARTAKARGCAVVQHVHNYRMVCAAATLYRDGQICEACLTKRFGWPALVHRCYRGSLGATGATVATNLAHRLAGTWSDQVDAFICMTRFGRDQMIRAGFPAERLFVKPHFVFPDPGVGPGGDATVLYVGRLDETKGLDILFKAWEAAAPDLRLALIGEGPLEAKVRAFVAARQDVDYLGPKPYAEVLERIGRAAALVFPSKWYETFGRVIIEAFAKGTPVIAAELGGAGELVEDGATGFLFAPSDPASAAHALGRIAGLSPEARATMRLAARDAFQRHYSAPANYRQLMAIYETALARSRAHHPAASSKAR